MLLCTLVFLIINYTWAQKPSPCPSIFAYEPPGNEENRWYARITTTTPEELNGVWLRIQLDQPAELLGNWFGEASSDDNKDYLIKNRKHHLQPNTQPLSVRFFVKYNPANTVPSVIGIRLNGRVICPATTSSPSSDQELHISQQRPTTQSSVNNYQTTSNYQTTNNHVPNSNNYRPTNNQVSNNNYQPTNTQQTNSQRPFDTQQINNRQPITATVTSPSLPDLGNIDDEVYPGDLGSRRPIIKPSSIEIQGFSCGTVKVPARPLITHGQGTSEGQWPWHAAIYRYKGINMQYICGASLISQNHILTAAHCVAKSKTNIPISPEILLIYLGKYSLYKQDSNVQTREVAKISIHPQYNASYFQNDLAVLRLSSPVELTDFVRYVCLWEDDINLSNVVERLGTVVGWGFDETGEITPNLMQAKMPVVSTETCIFSNREFFSRFTSEKTYCAGFRNGTSACTGDSGGGMVFPKSGGSTHNPVWQLRGVVSLSAALQNEKVVCDTSNYIVFTDVAKHLDWVRSAMKS